MEDQLSYLLKFHFSNSKNASKITFMLFATGTDFSVESLNEAVVIQATFCSRGKPPGLVVNVVDS